MDLGNSIDPNSLTQASLSQLRKRIAWETSLSKGSHSTASLQDSREPPEKGNHRADSRRPGTFWPAWKTVARFAGASRKSHSKPVSAENATSPLFSDFEESENEPLTGKSWRIGRAIIQTTPDGLKHAKDIFNLLREIHHGRSAVLFGDYPLRPRGLEEVALGLYGTKISTGPTSETFNIDATVHPTPSWTLRSPRVKFTVKRLYQRSLSNGFQTENNFHAERRVLDRINSHLHSHIIETSSAFFEEIYGMSSFMFAFPPALGSLEQLFQGTLGNADAISSAKDSLRHQFVGLAGALTHLHEACTIAHGDIEPSSVLVYADEKADELILKLADFGMFIDLSAIAAETSGRDESGSPSPNTSNTHTTDSRNKHTSADIWKLCYVLTELFFFVDQGSHGVFHLRRRVLKKRAMASVVSSMMEFNHVQISHLMGLIRSHSLSPRIFAGGTLDANDSGNVELARLNAFLSNMLANVYDGMTARDLFGSLTEVLGQRCYDGTRFVQLYPGVSQPRVSMVDRMRLQIETWTQAQIDWSPFPPVSRPYCRGEIRVDWLYGGRTISVSLSADQADRYKEYCFPASRDGKPILPISHRNDLGNAELQPIPGQSSQRPTLDDPEAGLRPTGPASSDTDTPGPLPNMPLMSKEIYWCVDRFFSEPKEIMREPISVTNNSTDDEFYSHTRQVLGRTRGQLLSGFTGAFDWLRNRLSWKTCVGVDFRQFYIIKTGHDQVLLGDIGLPPLENLGQVLSEYEHAIQPPDDMQMKLVAAQIVSGLRHSDGVQGQTEMISLLPKKRVPPDFNKKMRTMGWGMHAQMGLSVKKMLWWLLFCVVSLIISAAPWLIWVDRFDLQNAFMPRSTILAVLTICVAVAQTVG